MPLQGDDEVLVEISKQPAFKLITLHLIAISSLRLKHRIATMAVRTKRLPQRIFERPSHSVSIDESDSIRGNPLPQVLNDDADINPHTNNQSLRSLKLNTHISRTNSNHSSSHGKSIQTNHRSKTFSNNPRTLANRRAKEAERSETSM